MPPFSRTRGIYCNPSEVHELGHTFQPQDHESSTLWERCCCVLARRRGRRNKNMPHTPPGGRREQALEVRLTLTPTPTLTLHSSWRSPRAAAIGDRHPFPHRQTFSTSTGWHHTPVHQLRRGHSRYIAGEHGLPFSVQIRWRREFGAPRREPTTARRAQTQQHAVNHQSSTPGALALTAARKRQNSPGGGGQPACGRCWHVKT